MTYQVYCLAYALGQAQSPDVYMVDEMGPVTEEKAIAVALGFLDATSDHALRTKKDLLKAVEDQLKGVSPAKLTSI